jgi:TM2 domain-containing membrane protein YozV
MNCAQHTETAAVAYCRACGKALCEACKREVQGTIYCEPCLAARIHPGAGANFGAGTTGAGYGPPRGPEDTSPGLALFLGFIPGVGAFYNGQFLKGFVHVIVFSTLIWMSDHGMGAFAGILIMAWFFYMVFDAYTTAKARRYGLPIPDPLGLNAILEGKDGTFRQRVEQAGERLGTQVESAAQNLGQQWQKAGGAAAGSTAAHVTAATAPPPPGAAPNAAPGAPPSAAPGAVPGSSAFVGPQGTYYSGPEGTYYVAPAVKERERSPVGAAILIGLGVLLLLANLGWFSFHWVTHLWPAFLIFIGVWLFVKRQRNAR